MLIDPATGRVLLMSDAPIAGHMPVLLSFQLSFEPVDRENSKKVLWEV